MIRLCITHERRIKTRRIMEALETGSDGKAMVWPHKVPPGKPFVIWGHRWNSIIEVKKAQNFNSTWWLIDNGFNKPARGGIEGYYSITKNGIAPTMFEDPDMDRLPVEFPDWNPNPDGHVLLTMNGIHFGEMMNFKRDRWLAKTLYALGQVTQRKVIVRNKETNVPLMEQLGDAWCVVTHSSKTAIDAIRNGIPAVVHEWNPAAAVSSCSLSEVEQPRLATKDELKKWWASLMAQQFTLDEMREGLPFREVIKWPPK